MTNDDDDLPIAIHENKITLLGVEVRVYVLDDGRRIIHAEDFHELLRLLNKDSDGENIH